jgi:cell division protein FtsI/penicillin-binding protein 2
MSNTRVNEAQFSHHKLKPDEIIHHFMNMHQKSNWRDYQNKIKRQKRVSSFNNLLKLMIFASVVLLAAYLISTNKHLISLASKIERHTQKPTQPPQKAKPKDSLQTPPTLDKLSVQALLGNKSLVNITEKRFSLKFAGQNLQVFTSIDPSLQAYILKRIDRKNSRYVGIVVMDPSTGKILSMAGYDKTDTIAHPCLFNQYPAASIFKIVTAVAAIEELGYQPNSRLAYNGRKHTLYRSQLKAKQNRYTNRVTFRDSFAKSINPVFGKIGSLYLGKDALEKYAIALGFNEHIDFEIPLPPSLVSLSDEPYQWAEIATGFNRETLISPLHGALMAASIMNQGRLIEPTIVEKIIDDTGQTLYESKVKSIRQAFSPTSTDTLYDLMRSTISSGTARKSFRGSQRDSILSKLIMGGKTGSINNRAHDLRFDWFVGFAQEKNGSGKLAISVVVAHEEYIGTRATRYARLIIREHFKNYVADRERKNKKDQAG